MKRQQSGDPLALTVPQVARLLQMSENTVYSLGAQDAIPHVRFGKLIRIPRWGLLQFIAASSGAPLPGPSELDDPGVQSVDDDQPHEEE